MTQDIQEKVRIQNALQERDARLACHIVEAQQHILDMLEHQSPQVLEAIIDYMKSFRQPLPGTLQARLPLRDALVVYASEALKAQRKMEQALYQGITGTDPS